MEFKGFLITRFLPIQYDRHQTQRLRLAQTFLRKSDVCTHFRNLIVSVVSELEKQITFNLFANDPIKLTLRLKGLEITLKYCQ